MAAMRLCRDDYSFRTERAFLKSERRNIFVESRDFRNAR
jgi:hypothetical protein